MESIHPFTNQVIAVYPKDHSDEVQHKLNAAQSAYLLWKQKSLQERIDALLNLATGLENNKHRLANLMANEMGKLLKEGIAEIEKCQTLIHYYAQHANSFLKAKSIETEFSKSYVQFSPIGVCLGIMPWNFPFWQVFRFVIPTLIAGNTVVVKHASNVQGCAQALEALFHQAGIPKDIYIHIAAEVEDMEAIIEHPNIKGISLTGSTKAGKAVAKLAAKNLKKCVFELGGSDPYIILKDADIELAANACTTARLLNAGQSCIGAKRFIVEKSILKEFTEALKIRFSSYQMGDPLDASTQLAPMAAIHFRDALHQQVEDSVKLGAEVILGGSIPNTNGAFYPATILTNVKKGMPAYEEELFGPVAAIIVVEDENEAIQVANDTIYGLGAAIFSRNIEKAEQIAAKQLDAGGCFVNGFLRSDARLPFGGIKESGYGRELSEFGIHEFCNIKTIVVV